MGGEGVGGTGKVTAAKGHSYVRIGSQADCSVVDRNAHSGPRPYVDIVNSLSPHAALLMPCMYRICCQ